MTTQTRSAAIILLAPIAGLCLIPYASDVLRGDPGRAFFVVAALIALGLAGWEHRRHSRNSLDLGDGNDSNGAGEKSRARRWAGATRTAALLWLFFLGPYCCTVTCRPPKNPPPAEAIVASARALSEARRTAVEISLLSGLNESERQQVVATARGAWFNPRSSGPEFQRLQDTTDKETWDKAHSYYSECTDSVNQRIPGDDQGLDPTLRALRARYFAVTCDFVIAVFFKAFEDESGWKVPIDGECSDVIAPGICRHERH